MRLYFAAVLNSFSTLLKRPPRSVDNSRLPASSGHSSMLPPRLVHTSSSLPPCSVHNRSLPASLVHNSLPASYVHNNSLPACSVHHSNNLPASVVHSSSLPARSVHISSSNPPPCSVHSGSQPASLLHYSNLPTTSHAVPHAYRSHQALPRSGNYQGSCSAMLTALPRSRCLDMQCMCHPPGMHMHMQRPHHCQPARASSQGQTACASPSSHTSVPKRVKPDV